MSRRGTRTGTPVSSRVPVPGGRLLPEDGPADRRAPGLGRDHGIAGRGNEKPVGFGLPIPFAVGKCVICLQRGAGNVI